jgi:hypothetical protein
MRSGEQHGAQASGREQRGTSDYLTCDYGAPTVGTGAVAAMVALGTGDPTCVRGLSRRAACGR